MRLNKSDIILTFKGGIQHTNLVIAEAKLSDKFQQNQDQIIYLQCKWFLINEKEQKTQIEGITTGFYQLSYEDIGYKLQVEATPVLEGFEFQGEPLVETIGPIEENSQTKQEALKLFQGKDQVQFLARVEKIQQHNNQNSSNNNVVGSQFEDYFQYTEVPKDVILKIGFNGIEMDFIDIQMLEMESSVKITLGEVFPVVQMLKKTNNFIEIQVDFKYSLRLKLQNNIQRDLLYLIIEELRKKEQNSFLFSKNLKELEGVKQNLMEKFQSVSQNQNQEEQQNQNQSQNEKLNLKLQELEQQCEELKEENDTYLDQIEKFASESDSVQKSLQKYKQSYLDINFMYENLTKESSQISQKYHSMINEKQIFLQDNQQLKLQLKQRDQQMEILNDQIENLEKKKENENFQEQIHKLKKEIERKNQDIQNQERFLEKVNEQMEQLKSDNEKQFSELNHWKKKYQSLKSESQHKFGSMHNLNYIKQQTLPQNFNTGSDQQQDAVSNPSFNTLSRKNSNSTNNSNSNNNINNSNNNNQNTNNGINVNQNKEIERLQHIISVNEHRLERLRQDYNKELQLKAEEEKEILDSKKGDKKALVQLYANQKNGKVSVNNIKQQHTYMQKLVNSLTENMEEKQIALDNQQRVNKQLVDKVLYMDQRIRSLEKQQLKVQLNLSETENKSLKSKEIQMKNEEQTDISEQKKVQQVEYEQKQIKEVEKENEKGEELQDYQSGKENVDNIENVQIKLNENNPEDVEIQLKKEDNIMNKVEVAEDNLKEEQEQEEVQQEQKQQQKQQDEDEEKEKEEVIDIDIEDDAI